jgi:REP element-mobilizing transposase RayT
MKLYKNTYKTETTRLKCWDYTNPWWYYITICTKNHKEWFGEVVKSNMELNRIGKIVYDFWNNIPRHNNLIELDYFIIMPNHLHGIIILNEDGRRDVACNVSTSANNYSEISPKKNSVSSVIRSYKSAVTRWAHKNGFEKFKWQPRFYDRIIRNEKELYFIRRYIELNPSKWELEKDLPENLDI